MNDLDLSSIAIDPHAHPESAEETPAWFCLQSQPKREHLAAASLRQAGFDEIFCPRIRYRRNTRRGPCHFVEALFPGYLFARFLFTPNYRQIRSSHGVSRIVSFSNRYPTLPDAVIENLRQRLDSGGVVHVSATPSPGDEVEVVEGPFSGLQAVVMRVMSGKERIRVLLETLGRTVETDMPLSSVLPAEQARVFVLS